jgi:hypothetical protein
MRTKIEEILRALERVFPHRGRGPGDCRRVDSFLLLEARAEQERTAQKVDAARVAGREDKDLGKGGVLEFRSAGPSGAVQAVLDVQADLGLLKRAEVTIDADQLAKAAPLRGVKHDSQFRLTDQADLQSGGGQRGRMGEVLEQVESARREMLGFVDHQQGRPRPRRKGAQQRISPGERVRLARQPQRLRKSLGEHFGIEVCSRDVRRRRRGRIDARQQGLQERRLARPDFAGQDHDPRAGGQTYPQGRECIAMTLSCEQKEGSGISRKGGPVRPKNDSYIALLDRWASDLHRLA